MSVSFPLLVRNKVVDSDDSVWKIMLLFGQSSVELVQGVFIKNQGDIAVLSRLIEEYFEMHHNLFPDVTVFPTHHLLTYQLIISLRNLGH